MKSGKHKLLASTSQQTAIAQYCVLIQPASSSTTTTTGKMENSSSASGMRPFVGGTKTLQAEVLWILKTITDHHSYTSNKSIDDLFMFPDSSIAATFSCGSNKTAYITKFGLSPFITREMTKQVNCSDSDTFFVVFDEGLNKTTKSKQLYLNVKYWIGDQVTSRYFGSQFMGHAKVVDLLKHFKVSGLFLQLKCIRCNNVFLHGLPFE